MMNHLRHVTAQPQISPASLIAQPTCPELTGPFAQFQQISDFICIALFWLGKEFPV